MKLTYALLIVSFLHLAGCDKIAVMMTASKKPLNTPTKLSAEAEQSFWKTLHAGRYQDIEKVDYLLTAAYLQNPNNPELAAHLGFLHIWKISERARLETNSPLITNEIILARKYFADAVELEPKNPVYRGFLGDSLLTEGKIFHDKREEAQGYFILKKAIAEWPQFNYFTAGYPMSTLDVNSKQYQEALEWQWKTLDLCARQHVDRKNPDFSPYMRQETHQGKQSACWNSWKAPYNFQGFFMNMGDMLAKTGDWQTAIVIYENAKLAKNYHSWPYKRELEKRIRDVRAKYSSKQLMFLSPYSCMACHQQ